MILISRLFSMNEYEMSTQLSPVFPIHTRGVPPNPCISHTYEKGGSGGAEAVQTGQMPDRTDREHC